MMFIDSAFSQKFWRLYELIKFRDRGDLILKNERVKFPSRYILYCLSNCPTSHIYMDRGSSPMEVIDGNKRLRTLIDFVENKFPLETGIYFNDLEGYLRDKILNYQMVSYLILPPRNENTETIIKFITESE